MNICPENVKSNITAVNVHNFLLSLFSWVYVVYFVLRYQTKEKRIRDERILFLFSLLKG